MAGLKLSSKPPEKVDPPPPPPEKKVEPPPPEPPIDVEKFLTEMEAIVADSDAKLKALAAPPEVEKIKDPPPPVEKENQMDYNSPLETDEQRKAYAQEILKNLPKAPTTVLPVSTDERLTEAQVAQRRVEAASAPPVLDVKTLEGKTPEQQASMMKAHLESRDQYFSNLMSRPAGTQMTKTESSALAGEIVAALRADGHRV